MKQKINNRKFLEDGTVVLNDQSLFDLLFIDPTVLNSVVAEQTSDVETYNKWAKIYDLPAIKASALIDHVENQKHWKMPAKYKELDIEKYIISKCKTDEEIDRCVLELGMYKDRNLYSLLQYIVYLVDTMREHDIVWGVGRGSSVSSYVLFLIGIHKINSIQYHLDIGEFLK